jgi:hypothetical protein
VADVVEELMDSAVPARSVADVAALPVHTESVVLAVLTDEHAVALARLPRLRALVQNGTSELSNVGAEALARIATLEVLDLEWSKAISDEALTALQRLTRLRWIDLTFCPGLSEEAIAAFARALPSCQIETTDA